jgi:hypothetical protein
MAKYYYVYYSYEEWGRGYIGRRECTCLPEEDVKYFGSFKDKSFCPTNKIILATFDSQEEMCQAEVKLHNFFEVDKNCHFANKARQTSSKFCNCGPRTEAWKKARSEAYMGEGNPNYGKPRTEEVKRKIRQTRKLRGCGKGNTNAKGNRFNLTPEQKENRRQAALNRPILECPMCGRHIKGNAGLTQHMKIHNR